MKENWEVQCSPYAKKFMLDMAIQLKEERKNHPEKSDEEWREWVMSQIEWKPVALK